MEWPESFYALRRGEGCLMCEQGRPAETPWGVRIFAGEVSDAYLQRAAIQRWPFPFPHPEPPPHPEDEFRADAEALRRLLVG